MKVSEYPTASSLNLSDYIYVVNAGLSRKATFTQVQALIGGGGGNGGNVTSPLSGNLAIGNKSITGYTGNRALQSGNAGQIETSAVTTTELGYLSGLSAPIQASLGNKANSSDLTLVAGNVTSAQGNISALQSQVTANAGNITTLQGNDTAQQAMIVALQGNDTAQQAMITDLQGNDTVQQTLIDLLIGNTTDQQTMINDLITSVNSVTSDLGNLTLSDLTDVDPSGATAGQVLISDGAGNWTPGNQTGGSGDITTQVIGNLANVDVTAASDGQVLTYHSGNDTWMAENGGIGNVTLGGGNGAIQYNEDSVLTGNFTVAGIDSSLGSVNAVGVTMLIVNNGGGVAVAPTSKAVYYFDTGLNTIIDSWGPDSSTPGKVILRGLSNDASIVNTGITIDVDGVIIWGAYKLPTVDGSAGQVLQANGDGTTSWVTL